MPLLVTLALVDAAAGLYFLQYAVRRQRANRAHLAFVALVLIGCGLVLGYLALPEEQPGRLPPAPGELV